MKILFSKNNFAGPISGADEIAVTYAVELQAAGHETAVLLVSPPAVGDPLAARLRAAGVPLATLASPAFRTSLAAGRKLAIGAMRAFSPASQMIRTRSRRLVFDLLQRYHDTCCEYLRRNRPDVLHVMTPDPGAVMLIRAAHATGVPVVYQEVGIPFHPPGFEEVYERFVSVLPLCAGIAVLSPLLADELNRVLPDLIPACVVPLISQDATNGGPPRPQSESVSFGFAARLEHLKGPLQLIEGFSIAQRVHPAMELKIAGEGSQRQQIAHMLHQMGLQKKCHLVGVYKTLKERNQFMRSIDVFVLPSLSEGTPNAIIEAMAQAKPIIATCVGGIPDVVSADEGILVPSGDARALGEAMARLARDEELRKRMGRAAREKYELVFAPKVVLPLLLEFYQRVIQHHSNGNNGAKRPLKEIEHPWSAAERCAAVRSGE
ncbi:MAG: glycosyl transferase group 1 [Acidobacteria bacterium]|nr:glycosyl transferase group 1 [Acidobacteriota bacterium]